MIVFSDSSDVNGVGGAGNQIRQRSKGLIHKDARRILTSTSTPFHFVSEHLTRRGRPVQGDWGCVEKWNQILNYSWIYKTGTKIMKKIFKCKWSLCCSYTPLKCFLWHQNAKVNNLRTNLEISGNYSLILRICFSVIHFQKCKKRKNWWTFEQIKLSCLQLVHFFPAMTENLELTPI